MGAFGGYYKGDKKKLGKKDLEKKAKRLSGQSPAEFRLPEVIRKPKNEY